jgi:hypothetical protein
VESVRAAFSVLPLVDWPHFRRISREHRPNERLKILRVDAETAHMIPHQLCRARCVPTAKRGPLVVEEQIAGVMRVSDVDQAVAWPMGSDHARPRHEDHFGHFIHKKKSFGEPS